MGDVPQGRSTFFIGAVSASYVLRVDISSGGSNYRGKGLTVLNMDASIVVTVSFDGVTDGPELDPADAPGITLDNFHPGITAATGTIYIKSASGTPRVQVMAWA